MHFSVIFRVQFYRLNSVILFHFEFRFMPILHWKKIGIFLLTARFTLFVGSIACSIHLFPVMTLYTKHLICLLKSICVCVLLLMLNILQQAHPLLNGCKHAFNFNIQFCWMLWNLLENVTVLQSPPSVAMANFSFYLPFFKLQIITFFFCHAYFRCHASYFVFI